MAFSFFSYGSVQETETLSKKNGFKHKIFNRLEEPKSGGHHVTYCIKGLTPPHRSGTAATPARVTTSHTHQPRRNYGSSCHQGPCVQEPICPLGVTAALAFSMGHLPGRNETASKTLQHRS